VIDLIGNRTLPSLLDEQAAHRPHKVALVFEGRDGQVSEYTYAEVRDIAARVAGGLRALGVGPGDSVVVHLGNGPEAVWMYVGLAWLGAVVVPSNTANQATELAHIIGWSDACLVVTDAAGLTTLARVDQAAGLLGPVVVGPGGGKGVPFATLVAHAPLTERPALHPELPLEIVFTSGTTALPKGVVLTHANWLWAGERSSRTLLLDESDRLLTALPLFHVNAQALTLMNALTLGATAIVLEQYSASRYIEQIRRHRATHISIVAMVLRTLLAQPPQADDGDHELRRVSYAINVTDAEKDAFESRFGVELINGYGLSEAMTEVTVCPVHGARRWPSIGLPVLDRQVRIVDADGNEVAPGEVGELTVRGVPGRTIFKEYHKDPVATAAAIRDGWLHTGDNAYVDDDGFVYFFDRAKDVIKRAGENVSASEVESVLVDHPDIVKAAVIGVPDPVRDEAVMAFVVLAEGATLTPEDVMGHCRERLARFKVPTVVEFRDGLPETSIGKIEKKLLRAALLEPSS
jgi:crotonobetaine/carnitine-CoA ligase